MGNSDHGTSYLRAGGGDGNSDHGTAYLRVGEDGGELRPLHYIYLQDEFARIFAKRGGLPPRRRRLVRLSGFGYRVSGLGCRVQG
jgi:hypothetical protein